MIIFILILSDFINVLRLAISGILMSKLQRRHALTRPLKINLIIIHNLLFHVRQICKQNSLRRQNQVQDRPTANLIQTCQTAISFLKFCPCNNDIFCFQAKSCFNDSIKMIRQYYSISIWKFEDMPIWFLAIFFNIKKVIIIFLIKLCFFSIQHKKSTVE